MATSPAWSSMASSPVDFQPLTLERWGDIERLFGTRGACGGCWCMWWRLRRSDWEQQRGAGNKRAFKAVVRRGAPTGLLAYAAGEPIAWCAFAPREDYPSLERSRILKRVDEQQVWSVTCFFVARPWRGRGLTSRLLHAAGQAAAEAGARVLEGYPHDLGGGTLPGAFVHTGLLSAFERAGFQELARRSDKRPILRKSLRRSPRR